MIIKATRVPTRGSALKKLIEHVENADDNDEVVLLRGNTTDLLDARQDARSFGRQYCIRHWIVAPSQEASFEKMLEAVDALAIEFGFDPARAVVRGHRKPKAASPSLFDGHIHILVPEIVDPISGRVLSSAHDWLRGEKVGKILSHDWQEPFVESTKPTPILAALRRDGRADVAAAYQAAFPTRGPRPVASFDTAAQQRLKRAGLDLPALQLLVAGALDGAKNRAEIETNLLAHGLVCKGGEKAGVYMIETVGGDKVGSLARLAKIKKAVLRNLMEQPNGRHAEETHYGRGDLPQYADAAKAARTDHDPCCISAGDGAAEPAWDDAEYFGEVAGERAADDREAGRNHQLTGRAVDQEGHRRHAERLRAGHDLQFALGLVPHARRLHLMLATANRLALSPDELGIVELGEIEDDARCARAMISVPPAEHSGLLAARTALTEANRLVNTRQIEFDGACAVVGVLQQRGPWWRRAIGVFTGGNYRRAREIRAAIAQQSKAQAVLVAVKRQRSDADSGLTREVQSHREAVRQHMEHWTKVAQIAERKASAAPRVYELLKLLPGSIHFGAAGLCEIAAKLMPLQREQHTEAHDYTTAPLAAQP